MDTRFTATQSINLAVKQQPLPIEHYLRQPHRLVNALASSSQIQELGQDLYRLAVRPLKFLTLNIQPTVDLQIWTDAEDVVHIQSVACKIIGIDQFNQGFALNLTGRLYPETQAKTTTLKGEANLEVWVELPDFLTLTPRSIIELTGNSLLKSVLGTIKQRLLQHLVADYQAWARAESSQSLAASR